MSRVFFTDRDLGNQFPGILSAAGLIVERHRDHFPPECPDEVWLPIVGKHGWIAITHNSRISYTPNQLKAVIDYSVCLLVIVGHARYADLAHNFVATLGRVEAFSGYPYAALHRQGVSPTTSDCRAFSRCSRTRRAMASKVMSKAPGTPPPLAPTGPHFTPAGARTLA